MPSGFNSIVGDFPDTSGPLIRPRQRGTDRVGISVEARASFAVKKIGRPWENLMNRAVTYIVVDVEADGPIPGDFSMISLGAVILDRTLDKTFFGQLFPISDRWVPDALAACHLSREETLGYEDPATVMQRFADWIHEHVPGRPVFVSDNNGFDWQFVNWYFIHFMGVGNNPFGHTSVNLGSLYKGIVRDMHKSFKHLRKTRHTHHPVNDALGNAEALLALTDKYGLGIMIDQ